MVETAPPIAPYPSAPLVVVDPDPRWPEAAARIAAIIAERRPDVAVHHIGSTAVPGLAAKPVIDIGVDAGDAVERGPAGRPGSPGVRPGPPAGSVPRHPTPVPRRDRAR